MTVFVLFFNMVDLGQPKFLANFTSDAIYYNYVSIIWNIRYSYTFIHLSNHKGAVTMEKRYTVRQAVTMTGVKSYVMRYWEEELDLHIGRNELGHRYYTPYDIQLFLKINELKSRGLQLKAIRALIPQMARNVPDSDKAIVSVQDGEAVEIEDILPEAEMKSQESVDNDKIVEFQEILERLIQEEMQRKKEGEYRCRSLDEAIRRQQQARREAAAATEGKKNKRNKKGCR